MKERFIERSFSAKSLLVIQQANEIVAAYQAQGYMLTLRQLYYQFVSRDLLPNRQSEYKRLGSIINDARLAGQIDWSAIEDRTRNLETVATWRSPTEIIDVVASQYRENLWRDQPTAVEVWIEKDALVGVIEPVCTEFGVPYFACRGYASQSEVYAAGKRLGQLWLRERRRPIVLHLGDHDPSGLDMTRDNLERLSMFARCDVEVRRLALNMDQIREYNPPPNPAKDTDARFTSYQEEHGDESWELDALEPSVISDLIRTEIDSLIDYEEWGPAEARQDKNKRLLGTVARQWNEVVERLDDDEDEPEGDDNE